MSLFVIADTHFFHELIIKHCDRPFIDIDHMNRQMVASWNFLVGLDDWTLHLGDVGWENKEHRLKKLVLGLNGHKRLVPGNHDGKSLKHYESMGFEIMSTRKGYYEFEHTDLFGNTKVYIAAHRVQHLPEWVQGDDRIRLCGHAHNNSPQLIRWWEKDEEVTEARLALNCCVEHWGYGPMPIEKFAIEWEARTEALRSQDEP